MGDDDGERVLARAKAQHRAPTRRGLTIGAWVAFAGGVALVIGSLLPWYDLPRAVVLDGAVHQRTFTAWSRGYAPSALLPMVLALAVWLPALVARLADLHLPERMAGFGADQLRMVLAVALTVLMVGEVVTGRWYGPVALERRFGLWISLLGAIALLVGVVIDRGRSGAFDP